MSELIPFGKYKGQPIEVMALDHAYMDWVRQQSWFADKYPSINTLIINNFTEPSETPEHNAMQAAFFKKDMQIALINILVPDAFNLSDKVFRNYVGYRVKEIVLPAIFPIEDINVNIEAEYFGFDIYLRAEATLDHIDQGINYGCWFSISCAIELKPCLGDDYPAVLRQVKANRASRSGVRCILIVGSYEGKGADWNTVKEIFKASQIDAFLISDIGGV